MSVLIQSGISFKSVKLDINFVIHCFFIVTVGAKIITGFPSLLASSRPNIVFPEPGAATIFIFHHLKIYWILLILYPDMASMDI